MLMRATPRSLFAGPSPVGPPGWASVGSASGLCAYGGCACPGPCGACAWPASIGALGCSVGPAPGSVVCANPLSVNAPASAKVNTAELPENMLFITHLCHPDPSL